MNPFKTFIFLTIILGLVFLYNKKQEINDFFIIQPKGEKSLQVLNEIFPDSMSKTYSSIADTTLVTDTLSVVKTTFDTIHSSNFFENSEVDTSLNSFFRQLKNCNDTLVRIAYFGDSQIEGDHITYSLRSRFQKLFGGSGMGYMPAEMYFNSTKQMAIITNDFEKKILEKTGSELDKKYGFFGRYFTPLKSNCNVRIKNRSSEECFQQLKVIYSGKVNVLLNQERYSDVKSKFDDSLTIETFNFIKTPKDLNLDFSNFEHCKVYGFLLDSPKGVVTDCISFRGGVNMMMNLTDTAFFASMGISLNVSLIVLQFGLNVIPDQRTDYSNFRIALERDIHYLKELMPNISIVVVGVSDMAHKINGELHSYPNIKLIIEAQRKAALNEHVAFWNMNLAMGGDDAIIQWVDKGWARSDYAHLTKEGSDEIGNLLASDLLNAFEKYNLKND